MSMLDNKTPAAEQLEDGPKMHCAPTDPEAGAPFADWPADAPPWWPEGATYAPGLFRRISLPFSPANTPKLITEVLQVTSDALGWYDAMGPTEAARRVAIDQAALLRMLCLGGFNISAATKH